MQLDFSPQIIANKAIPTKPVSLIQYIVWQRSSQ